MAAQKKPTKGVTIRKNAIIKLFLIILISCTGIADAEQTKTIKYLANEPLTLLDLGIYRLNRFVNEDPYGSANVSYDWESNKITIHINIIEDFVSVRRSVKTSHQAHELVSQLVNSLRIKLGVNYQT